jgi:HEAT repeat protein
MVLALAHCFNGFSSRALAGSALVAVSLMLTPAAQAVEFNSPNDAFRVLRSGPEADKPAAVEWFKGRGVKGLWAILGELKLRTKPEDRAPVLELFGDMGSIEASHFEYTQACKKVDHPLEIAACIRAGGKLKEMKAKNLGYMDHPDANVRQAVIDAMRNYGPDACQAEIEAGFASQNVLVKTTAIEAAGALKMKQFVLQVVALLDDPKAEVVVAAIKSLGLMEYSGGVSKLQQLSQSADPVKAIAAVDALARMTSEDAQEALTQFILGPGSDEAKSRAILTIAQRGQGGIEVLLTAYASQNEGIKPEIKKQILGDKSEGRLRMLSLAFRSGRPERIKAAGDLLWSLGASGEDAVLANLRTNEVELRDTTRTFLIDQDKRTVARLNSELKDKDDNYVREIIYVLGQIRDPSSLVPLAGAGRSLNASVRRSVVEALTNYRNAEAVGQLKNFAQDSDIAIRRACLKAASGVNTDDAFAIMESSLSDGDLETRVTAIRALGQSKQKRALKPLQAVLSTAKGYEKRAVVEAIARIPGPEADGVLIPLMEEDEDPEIRRLAEIGLTQRQSLK